MTSLARIRLRGILAILALIHGIVWAHRAVSQVAVSQGSIRLRVKVNNVERIISSGEKLRLSKGDKLVILDALLVSRAIHADTINFVGTRGKGIERRLADDSHKEIDTLTLPPEWSLGGEGKVYRIVISHRGKYQGELLAELDPPTLKFLEIKINNDYRKVNDGERVRISSKDLLKVMQVSTSDGWLDKTASVKFLPADPNSESMVSLAVLNNDFEFGLVQFELVDKQQ